jgi:DNA polymerase-3 subunit alpha
LTRLGGLVAAVTPRLTKKQERMAVLQVEDLDGSVEVVMFPEAYREYGNMAVPDRAVLVCGAVRTEDKPRVIAAEVYPLEKAPELFSERVGIHLPAGAVETDMLDTIRSILRAHAGPIPVTICLEFPGGEKVFLDTDKAYNVCPAKELVEAICHVVGEEGVYVAVSQAACRRAARSRRHGPRDEGAEGPAAGEIGS